MDCPYDLVREIPAPRNDAFKSTPPVDAAGAGGNTSGWTPRLLFTAAIGRAGVARDGCTLRMDAADAT
jgi:hypothetical protein